MPGKYRTYYFATDYFRWARHGFPLRKQLRMARERRHHR